MDRRKILVVVAVVVAALGAALVFVYASGAEDRARDKIQTVSVLVAIQQIQPGESASDANDAGKIVIRSVPADEQLQGSTAEGRDFTDTVALTTVYPGEQLLTQKFGTIEDIEGRPTLPIPKGMGAATFQLSDQDKVGSFAQPGSHVAVYIKVPNAADVLTDEEQQRLNDAGIRLAAPACLIEDDLLVLGVGSTSVNGLAPSENTDPGADNAQGEVVGTTLMTAAVTSDQAAILLGLSRGGADEADGNTLIFVLRNDESKLEPTPACEPIVEAITASLTTVGASTGAEG